MAVRQKNHKTPEDAVGMSKRFVKIPHEDSRHEHDPKAKVTERWKHRLISKHIHQNSFHCSLNDLMNKGFLINGTPSPLQQSSVSPVIDAGPPGG